VNDSSSRYLPDSAKQIAESVKRLGLLWNQLCEAAQAATARVNKGRQGSDHPVADEARKAESEGEAPVT
jgi:hypothetical protein